MNRDGLEEILKAYRQGATADILQQDINGEWGPIWTIPPCSPEAVERAGRQFIRSHALRIRYTRRARINSSDKTVVEAVLVTVLPERTQIVLRLDNGSHHPVQRYLRDNCLDALEIAIHRENI